MKKEFKSCYGVVAILDALGARALNMSDAMVFLEKFKKMQNDIKISYKTDSSLMKKIGFRQSPMKFLVLGDMLVFVFPGKKDTSPAEKFSFISKCMQDMNEFFIMGLSYRIFLRGVISIGEMAYADNAAVGPAINDAITWAEQADWIGIHLSPSCGMYFERFRKNSPSICNGILYDVPLSSKGGSRNGGKKRLWCSNWVQRFAGQKATMFGTDPTEEFIEDRRRLVDSLVSNEGFPPGTESKYTNTLDFFDYSCETKRSALKSSATPTESTS